MASTETVGDYRSYLESLAQPLGPVTIRRCGGQWRDPSLAVRGVYFVACEAFVKIGHAKDIRRRMEAIVGMNPHKVRLLAYIATPTFRESRLIEQKLHRLFAADRVRLEWFHFTDRIRAFIEQPPH